MFNHIVEMIDVKMTYQSWWMMCQGGEESRGVFVILKLAEVEQADGSVNEADSVLTAPYSQILESIHILLNRMLNFVL